MNIQRKTVLKHNSDAMNFISGIAQKRGISTEARGKKGFFYLGGLTEGGETIIFLAIVVLFPQVFVPLAWVFGLLCWITTGTRVWSAIMQFSDG